MAHPSSGPARRPSSPVAAIALAAWLAAAGGGCDAKPYREVAVDLDAGAAPAAPGTTQAATLRFAVAAMESPRETYAGYSRLLERLGQRLEAPIELVQRRTYTELNELLVAGRLDVALLCTGGWLDLRRRQPEGFEILAVPRIDGATTYPSVVIVPAASPAASLRDLAGKRFAFTDELSFSGRAYVVHQLHTRGDAPDRFFASTTYTHSHARSIRAVADGLVDGAVVHGIVLRHQLEREPALAARVKEIDRSSEFGMMPIVASRRLPPKERERIRAALLALAEDGEAAQAMRDLHIDAFAVPAAGAYDSARALVESIR